MNKILVFIILGLLIVSSILIVADQKQNELNFNGIKINSKDYKSITDPLPEGKFILCSIKDNKCNLMLKGNLG